MIVIENPFMKVTPPPKVETGLKLPSSLEGAEKWIYAKVISIGTGTKCINGEHISGEEES